MTKGEDAIISIRPSYAEAILSGQKTVELRRRIPALNIGTRLWIYSTLPVGAVVGSAIVQEILRGTPDEIWDLCHPSTGVDRNDFDAYYMGTDGAIGLVLTTVKRRRPINIEKLRQLRKGFHPPQVLARLSSSETRYLSRLASVVS